MLKLIDSNYIFMIIIIWVIFFPLTYWIYETKKAKILTIVSYVNKGNYRKDGVEVNNKL